MWPVAIAPYEVVILPLNMKDEELAGYAQSVSAVHGRFSDVVLDDRKERAGVKFNDADLIGYPVQIVIGKDTKSQWHRRNQNPPDWRKRSRGQRTSPHTGTGNPCGPAQQKHVRTTVPALFSMALAAGMVYNKA